MWFCAIEIKFNLFQWHRSNELFYYKNDFVHMSNINLRSLSLWWQRHFHKFETRKTFVCVTKKLNMQNACLYFYVAFINVSHSHLHKRFYHMCAIHIYYITASLLQDVTFVSIQRKRGLKVKHLNHFFFWNNRFVYVSVNVKFQNKHNKSSWFNWKCWGTVFNGTENRSLAKERDLNCNLILYFDSFMLHRIQKDLFDNDLYYYTIVNCHGIDKYN